METVPLSQETAFKGHPTAPRPQEYASPVEILEVKSKGQLKQFLGLPRTVYGQKYGHYVMPLEAHVKMMMGKLGTPDKHFYLAYADGKPVARLGTKVHRAGQETRLHFGFFECDEKYPQAAQALIDRAHSMYPHLEMMGPFHFRQEDPYIGILVEGYDSEPYFMMPYNPPYYDGLMKSGGLSQVMDLYTYDLHREEGLPKLVLDNSARAKNELNLTVRTLDPKNLYRDARIIAGIFNEALSSNWGFEEFVEDQINEMVTLFKLFIDHRVVTFAQKDGRDIGCLIMIPNYNHLIKPCQGKLTPGLLWRYFQRMKTTRSIRGYALGVLKEFQGKGVGSYLTDEMYKIGGELKYDICEVSWVLANNSGMNDLAKAMGGKRSKVYRLYSKAPLSNALHN